MLPSAVNVPLNVVVRPTKTIIQHRQDKAVIPWTTAACSWSGNQLNRLWRLRLSLSPFVVHRSIPSGSLGSTAMPCIDCCYDCMWYIYIYRCVWSWRGPAIVNTIHASYQQIVYGYDRSRRAVTEGAVAAIWVRRTTKKGTVAIAQLKDSFCNMKGESAGSLSTAAPSKRLKGCLDDKLLRTA